MNDREHAGDLRVHEGLKELSGHEPPVDHVEAVLARVRGEVRPASRGLAVPRQPASPRWLQVAMVVIGIAVVFAATLLRAGGDDVPVVDPHRFDALRVHRVEHLEAVALLPIDARRIDLRTNAPEVIDALVAFESERADPGVVVLDANEPVDDARIATLARLSRLERLELSLAPTTTAGALARLAQLPRLTDLVLVDCPLTGRALATLGELQGLRALQIRWSAEALEVPRQPDGVAFLARLPRLQELRLGAGWLLSAEDLRVLESLRDLRCLDIAGSCGRRRDVEANRGPLPVDGDGVGATDDTLRVIGRMRSLVEIGLCVAPWMTAEGVSALEGLPNLRSLYLAAPVLDSPALLALPSGIERLVCETAGLPVAVVARLPNLKELSLWKTRWTQADWLRVDPSRLAKLRVIGSEEPIPAEWLARCVRVRDLEIVGMPDTGDEHIEAIARMTDLERLHVSNFGIADRHVPLLAHAKRLHTLEISEVETSPLSPRKDILDSLRELPLRRISLPGRPMNSQLLQRRIKEMWPGIDLDRW